MNSIIEKAIADYNEIKEAAETLAVTKLKNKYSDDFRNFLNEEIRIVNSEDNNLNNDSNADDIKSDNYLNNDSNTENNTNDSNTENNINDSNTDNTNEFDLSDIIDYNKIDEILDSITDNDEDVIEFTDNDINNNNDMNNDGYKEKYMKLKETLSDLINSNEESINDETKNTNDSNMNINNDDNKFTSDNIETTTIDSNNDENSNDDDNITDDEIDAILNSSDFEDNSNDIDEILGISHSANKTMSANNPKSEFASNQSVIDRRRPSLQENKKTSALINQIKDLTKKLNESKSENAKALSLIEDFKNVSNKYSSQLKDMAIFNTNLANVNNLLVNENLNLSYDDKINIVNEFKNINNINESVNKYNSLLNDYSKNVVNENIEDKLNKNTILPSTKTNLNEVVENTAYSNDEHVMKMKKIIKYVENRNNNNKK